MPPQQLRCLAQPPAKTNPAQKCSGLHAYTSLPWAAWAAVTSSHCSPANKTLKVVGYLGIAKRPHHHHPHSNRPHHPNLYSLLTPFLLFQTHNISMLDLQIEAASFVQLLGGGEQKQKKPTSFWDCKPFSRSERNTQLKHSSKHSSPEQSKFTSAQQYLSLQLRDIQQDALNQCKMARN